MTSPEVRLALANLNVVARGRTLAVGLSLPDVDVFHTDLRAHRQAAGSTFAAWPPPSDPYDSVVVRMHPAAERTRMLLALASSVAREGARVTLIGHNDAGARSAAKHVESMIGPASVLDARYHCRAFIATAAAPGSSSLRSWRTSFDFEDLTIVSYPGLFSHGWVDDGTRLLLSALPSPSGARALDVGCGSGVIGAWLGARGVAVDAVDVDAFALQACSETAPRA
ncbi:MAG: methyltransferase, partial [Actinomycetota bacterium]